jgi:hypothetical protein
MLALSCGPNVELWNLSDVISAADNGESAERNLPPGKARYEMANEDRAAGILKLRLHKMVWSFSLFLRCCSLDFVFLTETIIDCFRYQLLA